MLSFLERILALWNMKTVCCVGAPLHSLAYEWTWITEKQLQFIVGLYTRRIGELWIG